MSKMANINIKPPHHIVAYAGAYRSEDNFCSVKIKISLCLYYTSCEIFICSFLLITRHCCTIDDIYTDIYAVNKAFPPVPRHRARH